MKRRLLKTRKQERLIIAAQRRRGSSLIEEYDRVTRVINAVKVKRRKNTDTNFRKVYFDTRHIADTERQLRDSKLKPVSAVSVIRY